MDADVVERDRMLRLLQRLDAECRASTDSRPWTAKIGLTDGSVVDLGSLDLERLPVVILEDKRGKTVTYTTLGNIVRIELGKGGMPRLEGALSAEMADSVIDYAE